MASLLQLFILIPLIGYLISLLIPYKKEDFISWSAFFSVGTHLLFAMVFLAYWLLHDQPTLNMEKMVLFQTTDYEFFLDIIFDKVTAVYLFVGSLLTFLENVLQ